MGRQVGRPGQHGQTFTCAEERTWWTPTGEHHEQHEQYGGVRVRAWVACIPRCVRPVAATAQKATVRGTLVLVESSALPPQTRIP
jgi:hypothetical protein